MQDKIFIAILALAKSVAVHYINIFFVFKVIFECSPLIIGGIERITPFESLITG